MFSFERMMTSFSWIQSPLEKAMVFLSGSWISNTVLFSQVRTPALSPRSFFFHSPSVFNPFFQVPFPRGRVPLFVPCGPFLRLFSLTHDLRVLTRFSPFFSLTIYKRSRFSFLNLFPLHLFSPPPYLLQRGFVSILCAASPRSWSSNSTFISLPKILLL